MVRITSVKKDGRITVMCQGSYYTYYDVSPYTVERIRKFIKKEMYGSVFNILSCYARPELHVREEVI